MAKAETRTEAPAAPAVNAEQSFKYVPIARVLESPLNPRRSYDQKKIEELAESVRGVGIIEPLVVRPASHRGSQPGDYEIIAGSRRLRAAKLAELTEIPVLIREIGDAEMLEVMVVENNQRDDLNALEEAQGYEQLLKRDYTLERLAGKIGKSHKYVYDRLKLLQMIPEAKSLLLAGMITPGHAILLARLKPEDQKRTIGTLSGGLWEEEETLLFPDGKPAGDRVQLPSGVKGLTDYADYKARSVRELEAWIAEHVRLDYTAPIVADLFPETAAAVQQAAARPKKLKVIQITDEYDVDREAKEGTTERIFSGRTWKLADGSKGNPTCEKSVLGVHVLGPRRGQPMTVCVNKDCKPHWGKERAERQRYTAGGGSAAQRELQQKRYEAEETKRRAEEKRSEEKRDLWAKSAGALLKAAVEKIKSAKTDVTGRIVLSLFNRHEQVEASKIIRQPKSAEDYLRFMAVALVHSIQRNNWISWETFPQYAELLGVDVPAILAEFMPKEEKPKPSAKEASVDSKKTLKKKAGKKKKKK